MTSAKKHMCNIANAKLKKLLSKSSVNFNETVEIFKFDYTMNESTMCAKKKKETELSKIKKLRKRLYG